LGSTFYPKRSALKPPTGEESMSKNRRSTGKPGLGSAALKTRVAELLDDIRKLYCEDEVPWVVGYSGGKDSTAVLQLVWMAIAELDPRARRKPVHVISTDTLVENPIVAAWVAKSLDNMAQVAQREGLPFQPHRLTPEVSDSFWVNLIGRGYPAPRHKFRWCTERLKINPSNAFIRSVVRDSGETILVLGSRRAESSARARQFEQHEKTRVRDHLRANASLPNSLVYTPIESWTNDDVWLFLMQFPNPWGYSNKDLLTMYQGASEDSECPLVVDTSTPSCGDSRVGWWVCTMVEQDRSMQAMIRNDQEKEWMLPLLELRNELDREDRHLRDFRRMNGTIQLFHDRPIHGPYKQSAREHWLHRVLECQGLVRDLGPKLVANIELISLTELEEIRRIWVVEKHEFEDSLPRIYEDVTGEPYPGEAMDDGGGLGARELEILREICGKDDLHFELVRELLDTERRFRTMARRRGLFEELEGALRRNFYESAEEATDRSRRLKAAREQAAQGTYTSGQRGLTVAKSAQ
jgi:DNA sulfur modification protein DndC